MKKESLRGPINCEEKKCEEAKQAFRISLGDETE